MKPMSGLELIALAIHVQTAERWETLVRIMRFKLRKSAYFRRIKEGEDCPEMLDELRGDELEEATCVASLRFLELTSGQMTSREKSFFGRVAKTPEPMDIGEAIGRACLYAGRASRWLNCEHTPRGVQIVSLSGTMDFPAKTDEEPEETPAEKTDRREANCRIICGWLYLVVWELNPQHDRNRDVIAEWLWTLADDISAEGIGYDRQCVVRL